MAIDPVVKHLLRLEIFHGLKPLQITEIARQAERIVYKAGQTIIEDGAAGEAAVVVVSGEAVRTKAPMTNEPQDEIIEPGSMLGEMAMLIETDYSSTVVAREPVRALRITRDAMLQMMLEDPDLAEHLVAKIARRLHTIAAELRKIDVALATTAGADAEGETDPEVVSAIRPVKSDAALAPA